MTLVKRKVVTNPTPVKQVVLPPKEGKVKMSMDAIHSKYYGNGKSKQKKNEEKVLEKVGAIQKATTEHKSEVKKLRGETIDDVWCRVLGESVGKGLTDKQIAQKMNEAVDKLGKKHIPYSEKQVASHRSGYNNGKFPCQKGVKPTVKLEKCE